MTTLPIANIVQPLIDVCDAVLVFFHDHLLGSWGFSIIALTVVVRLILLPLTLKQFRSMQALQKLAPEIKALQEKHKDDKQRQQQEMMKFYQENKVKRLLREAFGTLADRLPDDQDVVVVARPEVRELAERDGLDGVARELGELVDKTVAGTEDSQT